MHSVVCIKQVPDSLDLKINPETGTLIRAGVMSIINLYDVHAIEAALQIKDQYGGRVSVITMGPPAAEQALREALSMGADQAVLISNAALGGGDTWATSLVLAKAIEKLSAEDPVSLVFAGKQTSDSDTAQVGPGVATQLGFTQFTYVMGIDSLELGGEQIQVRRLLEDRIEVVQGRLPALIAVVKEINKPRRASLPGLLRATEATIPVWSHETIGLSRDQVGLRGSPTTVARVFAPPARPKGEMIDVTSGVAAATDNLMGKLIGAGVLEEIWRE
jgi:electron transfer flavoprotein beta subunit